MRENHLRRAHLVAAGALLAATLSAQVPAGGTGTQSAAKEPATAGKDEVKPAASTAESDGSLTYIGKRLWFEVRKRLNLTTEQEEAQQRAAEALVRLKVGGFRIEQQATAKDPEKKN